MAKVTANYSLDLEGFTFSRIKNLQTSVHREDVSFSAPTPIGTMSSADINVFYNGWNIATTDSAAMIGGADLGYTTTGALTSGTVTSLYFGKSLLFYNAKEQFFLDFSIRASDLSRAISSDSVLDDHDIVARILKADDEIWGSSENDLLSGYDGNDSIHGNASGDIVKGKSGYDKLWGDGGADRMFGGGQNDVIYGGAGRDLLVGGTGADRLSGGYEAERDVFCYQGVSDSGLGLQADRIKDFQHGLDDINLSQIDANAALTGNQAFQFAGQRATSHAIWLVAEGADVLVRGDTDGNKSADFEIRLANIASASLLTSGDFIL